VARLLVEYVKDEVTIENWEGQPPARTVHLLRTLLKNRDKVTTEGIQTYLMALEGVQEKSADVSGDYRRARRGETGSGDGAIAV
jgi:hypothetical protein